MADSASDSDSFAGVLPRKTPFLSNSNLNLGEAPEYEALDFRIRLSNTCPPNSLKMAARATLDSEAPVSEPIKHSSSEDDSMLLPEPNRPLLTTPPVIRSQPGRRLFSSPPVGELQDSTLKQTALPHFADSSNKAPQ